MLNMQGVSLVKEMDSLFPPRGLGMNVFYSLVTSALSVWPGYIWIP